MGGHQFHVAPHLSMLHAENTPLDQGGKRRETEAACWFHTTPFVDTAGKRYPLVIGGINERNGSGVLVSRHPRLLMQMRGNPPQNEGDKQKETEAGCRYHAAPI